MAFSRLRNTEKRLNRQYLLGEDYQNVIASYPEKEPQCQWYLPHLSVCRPERSITKTRTVFDTSTKFQDASLNHKIPPDPKLEADLFEGLLSSSHCMWRQWNVLTNKHLASRPFDVWISSEEFGSWSKSRWKSLRVWRCIRFALCPVCVSGNTKK